MQVLKLNALNILRGYSVFGFCRFCVINRDREVAPTTKSRESEFPPTEERKSPEHFEVNVDFFDF